MSSRIDRYVSLAQSFSASSVLFHEAVAVELGLHVTDLKVLRLLGRTALTPGELVGHTGLTGAAITALVDRLERAGYVTRERDEQDRRRVAIRVVPAQVRRVDRLYADLQVDQERHLARYSNSEFETIVTFLTRTTEILAANTAKLRGS